MSRVYNFSPGPAGLPSKVLEKAQQDLLEWNGAGMSVMEMSHRGKDFMAFAEKSEVDLRELMNIPENYKVLFLQGGASCQFSMIPMNLLEGKRSAGYVNTGIWSKKAIKEAKKYCNVEIVASSEADSFFTLPEQAQWKINDDLAYVHYTPNETIGGLEFHWTPETGDIPLVADMSSTILSRPIDVSRYGLIYAGAQKNIGPAGLTIVIVRDDLLGKSSDTTPTIYDYKTQAEAGSMQNTPPTFSWYLAGLVFDWLKQAGGVGVMAETNQRKAEKLYEAIDNDEFYNNPIDKSCRSWMNVPFTLKDDALNAAFLEQAVSQGLYNLKGHRSVGGMRASIYNAMPESGVDALVDFMGEFSNKNG